MCIRSLQSPRLNNCCGHVFAGATGCTGTAGPLFPFSSFTFTNAGATGRQGPTLAMLQADSGYQAQSWTQNTAYLNETVQGVQIFTIPQSATYSFTVAGAGGGGGRCLGGRGAQVTVAASLAVGDKISIVVGQRGSSVIDGVASGGGGGSYVFLPAGALLVAAGGGGGSSCLSSQNGQDASLTTNGTAGKCPLVASYLQQWLACATHKCNSSQRTAR